MDTKQQLNKLSLLWSVLEGIDSMVEDERAREATRRAERRENIALAIKAGTVAASILSACVALAAIL